MNDSLTPEEKLLRLIKGPKADPEKKPEARFSGSAPLKPAIAEVRGPSPVRVSVAQGKGLMAVLLEPRILTAGMFLAAGYLVFTLVYSFVGFRPATSMDNDRPLHEAAIASQSTQKPFDYYAQAPSQRQLFTSDQSGLGEGAAQAATTDILKEINLVGIISGENPQVVIEDKKSQKTFYASKGQSVGEFTVADIQDGKIIISYKGQKFEVYL